MILLSKDDCQSIREFAEPHGIEYPDKYPVVLWPLPIIKNLYERIEYLEDKVSFLEYQHPRRED